VQRRTALMTDLPQRASAFRLACASVLSLELPALAVGAGLATVKGSRFSPKA